jgi:hypothetical protein
MLCERGFQVMHDAASGAGQHIHTALASASEAGALAIRAHAALNIAPPTDDAPFFFHMSGSDFFRRDLWNVSLLDFNEGRRVRRAARHGAGATCSASSSPLPHHGSATTEGRAPALQYSPASVSGSCSSKSP